MQTSTNSTPSFLDPVVTIGEFGITPAMRVADFGCGAGHLTILLAQAVGDQGRVTALDIMEDKLDSVRVQAKASGLENVDTVRANLEVLGSTGLADQSQDVVLLANILFQSNKKSEILKEASRVLKIGGRVILIEWKKGAGGFGPPDDLRTDNETMKNLFAAEKFTPSREFSAGQFHYGIIFTK